MRQAAHLLCFSLLIVGGLCDIYMHNPRGSNNRLDERNENRRNGNRLFDSQNNNRGGYNVGALYYFTGSVLPIEWTNQHACGENPNDHCEVVIQYACEDTLPSIRDGTDTNNVKRNDGDVKRKADKIRYGNHENYQYYQHCQTRLRNENLFTANQINNNKNKASSIFTRQNGGGTQRGWECPEERDYYPYWHPTPWRDIAVLTNREERCNWYKTESQNVKNKGYCATHSELKIDANGGSYLLKYSNRYSEAIPFDAPAEFVKSELEKNHFLGPVDDLDFYYTRAEGIPLQVADAADGKIALRFVNSRELAVDGNSLTHDGGTCNDEKVTQEAQCIGDYTIIDVANNETHSSPRVWTDNSPSASIEHFGYCCQEQDKVYKGCNDGSNRNENQCTGQFNKAGVGLVNREYSKELVCKSNTDKYICNTKETCESSDFGNSQWVELGNYEIEPPECKNIPFNRDNHLGNAKGDIETNRYDWVIPDRVAERCVLRIRYNISTADYPDTWTKANNTDTVESASYPAAKLTVKATGGQFTLKYDGAASTPLNHNANADAVEDALQGITALANFKVRVEGGVGNSAGSNPYWIRMVVGTDPSSNTAHADYSKLEVVTDQLTQNNAEPEGTVEAADYPTPLVNNPLVDFGLGAELELAVNPAQFGRTFQDRSHVFSIVERDSAIKTARIHNVNVRGRRGNIVQTYPSTEYNFVPTDLQARQGDYIHWQWTGSNTVPDSAGQGRDGTDRSNIVFVKDRRSNYPMHLDDVKLVDPNTAKRMINLDAVAGETGGEMSELDDGGVYFDAGLVKVQSAAGTYHYLCSRNNNFSNREQKATVEVVGVDGFSAVDLQSDALKSDFTCVYGRCYEFDPRTGASVQGDAGRTAINAWVVAIAALVALLAL